MGASDLNDETQEKKMRILLLMATVMLLPLSANAASHNSHKSEYAGEEHREIKSLSESKLN